MNALGLVKVVSHWECRRLAALHTARCNTVAGLPALEHLRESSRCRARVSKLARLADKAAQPRGAT